MIKDMPTATVEQVLALRQAAIAIERENTELTERVMNAESQLAALVDELRGIMAESRGVAGYHNNGEVAEWGEFELGALLDDAKPALDRLEARVRLQSFGEIRAELSESVILPLRPHIHGVVEVLIRRFTNEIPFPIEMKLCPSCGNGYSYYVSDSRL